MFARPSLSLVSECVGLVFAVMDVFDEHLGMIRHPFYGSLAIQIDQGNLLYHILSLGILTPVSPLFLHVIWALVPPGAVIGDRILVCHIRSAFTEDDWNTGLLPSDHSCNEVVIVAAQMCLDRVNILTSGQIDHTGEPIVSFGSELRCSVEVGIRICESIEGKLMFQVEISSLDDIPTGLSEQHDRLRSSEWSASFRPCLLNKFPQKHH